MPTYPYACTVCDNRFEIVQAFTDDALSVCAQCNGRLRKVFSSVGVVFKGSGFYRNDSRSAGSLTPASSGMSADTSSSSSSSSSNGSGGSGESTTASTPAKSDSPAKAGTSPAAARSTSSSGSAKDTSSAA